MRTTTRGLRMRRQISEAIKKVVAFDQVTVNEYPPGCGIAPHVDTHSAFTETILSLSLGDRCVIEFRHPNPSEEDHSAAAEKNTAAVTAAPAAQQNKNENSDDAMVFPIALSSYLGDLFSFLQILPGSTASITFQNESQIR